MDFEDVIKERKSTRNFSDRKISQEELNKILEAGRIAPTAKNNQPIKIYVIQSEDGLAKIDNASPCRYGAPTVLLVCGDKEKAFFREGHSTYEVDSCIVATHMMLEATNIGIDNIWVDMFDRNIAREEFNIPENLIPVCLLPMGYKSEICPSSPNHMNRKNINQIVEYK